jgi:hypothetical protein
MPLVGGHAVKIVTRGVIDWETGEVLEEESFDYSGPIAECKSSGSAPQPVDPYQQAGAQYGLATGTANYNAALNRTNSSNPLGSSTWSVNGYDGSGVGGVPGTNSAPLYGFGGGPSASTAPLYGLGSGGFGGGYVGSNIGGAFNGRNGNFGSPALPGGSPGMSTGTQGMYGGTGAPKYSQQTNLTPWADQMLQSPIDTQNIVGVPGGQKPYAAPGMPGGPDLTGSLNSTRNAVYNQQMGYLAPQFGQQQTSLDAQLAAQGATPGSEAWKNSEGNLGRQQTFANQQAIDSSIGAGNQEQAQLFGLGTQSLQNQMNVGNASLQNQLALRNAPISEYEQLQGNGSGGQINAQTPDISGAFGQQYQGQLAGYNAQTATNNADTGAVASLAAMAAIYF